jgi:hypothetical protein
MISRGSSRLSRVLTLRTLLQTGSLWRISILEMKQSSTITIDALDDKIEMDKHTTPLSALFHENPDDNITVQRRPH